MLSITRGKQLKVRKSYEREKLGFEMFIELWQPTASSQIHHNDEFRVVLNRGYLSVLELIMPFSCCFLLESGVEVFSAYSRCLGISPNHLWKPNVAGF